MPVEAEKLKRGATVALNTADEQKGILPLNASVGWQMERRIPNGNNVPRRTEAAGEIPARAREKESRISSSVWSSALRNYSRMTNRMLGATTDWNTNLMFPLVVEVCDKVQRTQVELGGVTKCAPRVRRIK